MIAETLLALDLRYHRCDGATHCTRPALRAPLRSCSSSLRLGRLVCFALTSGVWLLF